MRTSHAQRNSSHAVWTLLDWFKADIAMIGKRRFEDEPAEIQHLANQIVSRETERRLALAAMSPEDRAQQTAADDERSLSAAVAFVTDESFGDP